MNSCIYPSGDTCRYANEHGWEEYGRARIYHKLALRMIPYLCPTVNVLPDVVCEIIAKFLRWDDWGPDLWGEKSWGEDDFCKSFASSDIDVFITANGLDAGRAAMRSVLHTIRSNMSKHLAHISRSHAEAFDDTSLVDELNSLDRDLDSWQKSTNETKPFASRILRVMRTANTISIWGGGRTELCRTVQVVLILYKTKEEVLQFFDLDAIAMGYDGTTVWGLPRTLRALATGYNFVEPAKLRRWSTGPRILK